MYFLKIVIAIPTQSGEAIFIIEIATSHQNAPRDDSMCNF